MQSFPLQRCHHLHRLPPLPPPPKPPPSTAAAALCSLRIVASASSTSRNAPPIPQLAAHDTPASAFRDYQLFFASQRSETAEPVPLSPIHGSIPADFPAGTYYLAGPGIFSDDHGSTVHPLDGHGYLRAFDFRRGGGGGKAACWYSARYVATEAQREEREAATGRWRFTHRGPFSVLHGGRRVGNLKVMKNVANTSVLEWGRRVMCLWEGGDPYEVNPATLETLGPVDLVEREVVDEGGRRRWDEGGELAGLGLDVAALLLKPVLRGVFKMPRKRLLAHYKIDSKRKRLLMLSCNAEDMLLPRSNFTFYEYDRNFELKQKKEFTLPDHLMIHDWAFTDSHYILIGNRIKLDIPGSMLAVAGLHPMIAALTVNRGRPSTPIYVLPRFSQLEQEGRCTASPIEAPWQRWAVHIGNAFEERDGGAGGCRIHLQASFCSYRWFNFQKMFGYDWDTGKLDARFMNKVDGEETMLPHLVEISIELDAEGTCRGCYLSDLPGGGGRKTADFPAINPAFAGERNAYIYASSTSGARKFLPCFPFDSVVKLGLADKSAKVWSAGNRAFIGEPIFVPKGNEEDDGYVLAVEYAVWERMCYLVILDARRIGEVDAVVAKLQVPKHLTFPCAFHGFWSAR